MAEQVAIDDALYNRQRYVLGDRAMSKMSRSRVLISGLGGLGVEIAKNVALAGVQAMTLHDTAVASHWDLSTQFYLREAHIGRNRAEACAADVRALNEHVAITTDARDLATCDLSFLDPYSCVVLCEAPLDVQLRVDEHCRACGIAFLSAAVRGVFGSLFADLGEAFEVYDADGEEPASVLVGSITRSSPAVVTCLGGERHGLSAGDVVALKELGGLEALNGRELAVSSVVSPFKFALDVDTSALPAHTAGGVATQVKKPSVVRFAPLKESLEAPRLQEADTSKLDAPARIHAAFRALEAFRAANGGALPRVWDSADADRLCAMLPSHCGADDDQLVRLLSHTARGAFQPLCAFLGGVAAQEVLKAVTGKFTPLCQWLHVDMREVVPPLALALAPSNFAPRGHALDAQAACVGWPALEGALASAKLFVVGAGAIGCELLKNFALLGLCTAPGSRLLVTDPDLIERSNLSRQFLFRASDIRKPKSATAVRVAQAMNPSLRAEAALDKVGPQTEAKFTDAFFGSLDAVVNALDNVAARVYVDGRCTSAQRPLLESGTLGTKGHVQVIFPHLTETYASQQDPPEREFPICTVHSFPHHVEHCIQWSRDHFAKLFSIAPAEAQRCLGDPAAYAAQARSAGMSQYRQVQATTRAIRNAPRSFEDCVRWALRKHRAYYDEGIAALLAACPVGMKAEDGTPFWAPPKRPPHRTAFDAGNPEHLAFVRAAASLRAQCYCIEQPHATDAQLAEACRALLPAVPAGKRSKKVVLQEPSAASTEAPVESVALTPEQFEEAVHGLLEAAREAQARGMQVRAEQFEKDDDENHHVDFVWRAANLRAGNYSIEPADRLTVKRVAGHIIPAIATTTAAVSGLVAAELVKVLLMAHVPRESRSLRPLRNAFMNLALPLFSFSEPGEAQKTQLAEGVFFTVWDSWDVHDTPEGMTLTQFADHFQKRFKLNVTAVIQGQRMVYVAMMPTHASRLRQRMRDLLRRAEPTQASVDLVITFSDDKDNDVNTPNIRFFF